ncbi:hypothetical protein [Subtercola boreus]|nr:hypothetical protein [Subtercola boreus]TQL56018.1 hypothetical protein FB464_3594 [Subtercola boreus]
MNRYLQGIRPALSVLGIVLSVVVGYNTWAQIDAVNGDHAGNSHAADLG